jgi:hypothetical protein
LSCKLKEHEVYESLTDALNDSRLSRHVSYIPVGELTDWPVVITVERITESQYEALAIRGTSDYVTAVKDYEEPKKTRYATIDDPMRNLGIRISEAIRESAKENYMARRDDRYRTLLLKEIALSSTTPASRDALRDRLEKAETAIYSMPLPTFED